MAKAKKKQKDDSPEGGGTEVGISLKDMRDRDSEIFRGHLRGLLPGTLSMTYSLSVDRINEIVRQQRAKIKPLAAERAEVIVQDYLLQLDAMIDELAAFGAGLEGSSRVAAITARLNTMKEKREVLMGTNILPADLGQMQTQMTAMQAATAIIKVLDENDVNDKVAGEILKALESPLDPVAEEIEDEDVTVENA